MIFLQRRKKRPKKRNQLPGTAEIASKISMMAVAGAPNNLDGAT
jgi:hypothetical protein